MLPEDWGLGDAGGFRKRYRWASHFCHTGTRTSWCSGSWLVKSMDCLWWRNCGWRKTVATASGSGPGLAAHWPPCLGNACLWSSTERSWHQCWAMRAYSPRRWACGAGGQHFAKPVGVSRSGRGSWGCVVPIKLQKLTWWREEWRWSSQSNTHAVWSSCDACEVSARWLCWGRRKLCRAGSRLWHSVPTQGHVGPQFFCCSLHPLLHQHFQHQVGYARAQATSNKVLKRANTQYTQQISPCAFWPGRRRCGSEEGGKQRCSGQWWEAPLSRWRCGWRRTPELAQCCSTMVAAMKSK